MIIAAIRLVKRSRVRLRAKAAAARFAEGMPSARRRGESAWPRVALRWRRRRLRPRATHRGDTTRVHTSVLQPHVHVHPYPPGERIAWRDRGHHLTGLPERRFGIVRELRVRTRVLAESPAIHVWRTRERVHAHAPIESSAAMLTRRSTGTARARGVTLVASAALPVSRALAASRRVDWARPSVSAHRLGISRTARREAVVQEPLVHRTPRSRPILVLESAADRRPQRSGVTRVESRRRPMPPAQIVWREGAGPRRSAPDVIAHAASASSSVTRGSRSSPIVDDAGVNETFAARPRHAAVGLADFEPGLIDRLTDDVIRRVERRVRIERERRGIS